MRVLLVSDTHGSQFAIAALAQRASTHDCVLHAGDHARDAQHIASSAIAVRGNTDEFGTAPEERVVELSGLRIFLTHGHRLKVKDGLLALQYRAEELAVHVVVFGHTHVPLGLCTDGRLFVNPGSPSYPRGQHEASFAVLDADVDARDAFHVRVTHYRLDGAPLPGLSATCILSRHLG